MALRAILWKNYLLKTSAPVTTIMEIAIPVAFMGLLILIKSVTTSIDSPAVAYYCGQAAPWFYTTNLTETNIGPLQCALQPTQCTVPNYYQSAQTLNPYGEFYEQYGKFLAFYPYKLTCITISYDV